MRSGRLLFTLFFFIISVHFLYAHELLISGVYLGKNLYVQNPSCNEQSGFSIQSVYVNGKLKIENPTASTFELDLSDWDINTPLEIKIIYREDCVPELINPQVIKPKNSFYFGKVAALNDSLTWETKGEIGIHKFLIEKWTGNDWLIIQACDGKGLTKNHYRIKLNQGSSDNMFRLKYIDGNGRTFFSQVINYSPGKNQ